ncbi:MAG: hemolysin, partial [Clostridia bacterium]|nr:hemolysin [Clostridia bacterium]
DEEEEISKIDDDTYSIDGGALLDDVIELLKFSPFDPEEDEPDYDTLGGFVVSLLGYLPTEADGTVEAEYKNLRFTVLSYEERRIGKIKVEILPTQEPADEEDDD